MVGFGIWEDLLKSAEEPEFVDDLLEIKILLILQKADNWSCKWETTCSKTFPKESLIWSNIFQFDIAIQCHPEKFAEKEDFEDVDMFKKDEEMMGNSNLNLFRLMDYSPLLFAFK